MSKKFKSQASSSRAAAGAFGSFGGFSSASSTTGKGPSSLTYVAEPPDLTRLSEPQLAITFKNFQKKDEVTRTKALDELRDYVSSVESQGGNLDDGFLEAWVKIYPRASIDIARRVRQLAHSTQGSIATLVGKRVARFLPKVIGAWLAGLYDNDRPVHRSTLESFMQVFSTEEKRSSVWKIYQSSILEFVDDVILQQTPQTLSDERTVKPDDAEAKYARVVGTALLLFNRILGNSTHQELEKDLPMIESILNSKSLWTLAYHEDAFVRRCLYIFLRSAVAKEPEELDWKLVSGALIGKSLHASQLGSASELSETLLQVTSARPNVWTEDYSGKTSSSKRLLQYIQKSSQGGPSSFWLNLCQLLQIIPLQTLAKFNAQDEGEDIIGLSGAATLMESFQEGLNSRDEPRQNRAVGWKAYIDVGKWLANGLPEDAAARFWDEKFSPMVIQYVQPDQNQAHWSLPVQSAEAICTDYLVTLTTTKYTTDLDNLWKKLSHNLLEVVKLSSPEQSKEFNLSQDAVSAQAERLLGLQASILSMVAETDCESRALEILRQVNLPLLDSCLQVLETRNGKPYGAAAVVEGMVHKIPQVAQESKSLLVFVQKVAPELLSSPSADRLISIILGCRSWEGYGSSFENIIEKVVQSEPESSNAHAVQKLLSTLDFEEVNDKSGLGSLVVRALNRACQGSSLHWSIVIAVLQNRTSHGDLTESIFLSIINALSQEGKTFNTLQGLSQIAHSVPNALRTFQSGPHGSNLTGKLLFLAESPSEEVANLAESLVTTMKETVVSETNARSSFEILQRNFENVNEESLSIESLLDIAEELIHSKPEDLKRIAKDILPSRQSWETALLPFLELPPRSSTSITSPLGGIVHLLDRKLSDNFWNRHENIPRDSSRCSSAFRLTFFTVKILSGFDASGYLGPEELETLYYNLPLAVQLVDDDLSIENCNGITGLEVAEQREDYMEIVYEGRKVISGWAQSTEALPSTVISFWESKLETLGGVSPADFRVGEAFVKIMQSGDLSVKPKSPEEIVQLCRDVRTANPIRSASWMTVLKDSVVSNPAGTRLCNELVADSTGLKPQDDNDKGLQKLSLLNLLLTGEDSIVSSIPTQRLMFFVKNLIQCLQSESLRLSLKAEILQSLTMALPCIQEMYGSHWEECFRILNTTWEGTSGGDDALPVLLASFRLFARLKSIVADEDSNDDVKDTWAERKTELCNRLTSTLKSFDSSTAFHQPRDVTVDTLCRLVNTIPIESLEDVGKIFPLLTARSRSVQRAAYIVLHRYIPSIQEQVSFDIALSKTTVSLPDQLLSLLLGAPSMDVVSRSYGDDKVWAEIRSYLLSWKVVFDHFTNASIAVQENYVASIKENDVLIPLLEFMFDFLQKSHGKMVDASKFDIRSFELDQSETPEQDIQWLLVHLYFLCLKHLANMTKNWWLDTKKRIKGPVETWTERYVSPLIIDDSLKGVMEWMSTQDPNEERALSVKVSAKTAEIIASITVDEESPPVALSISLPPAYPLQPALVVSRSRVLVDEKKWKSWLLTIQGVIMFANGNLVDGLLAFRKNVQGALKGQSECAICYSVISTDMQTPNKRCATCKNTFHSVCLFRWFKSSNQSTCPLCRNNFVVSRLSAVRLGYLEDAFAPLLTSPDLETRRLPIINRGTYVRTTAIDHLVNQFLSNTPQQKKQIISLGAGTDTRIFRLLSSSPDLRHNLIYHEIDFAVNTTAKIKFIRATPRLQQALGLGSPENEITISEAGDALHSSNYHLHPLDLRSLRRTTSADQTHPPLPEYVDPALPTLLISECCLIYLSPSEAVEVVGYFTESLFGSQGGSDRSQKPTGETVVPRPVPLGLILYEPIRPDDAFGRTMVANLATRGIQLQTLHQYASLEAQRRRLREQGFDCGQAVADIDFIWERWVRGDEKERVAGLEMLDEMEEWQLLARHYCVAWGWREGDDAHGRVFDGWKGIEGQKE
ncbi:hypothetical protein FE257_005985 [Aspergillus nanangensis]|uniref:E3 ubiquitin-protein ligase listerin n=1 Tax=Aspergillus nanangensis TaxID=2582783 RepID=A0AAD4CPK0_ASPNN|nr:hypothetical protein FE257_005985 [Aspergillus nanangensis]